MNNLSIVIYILDQYYTASLFAGQGQIVKKPAGWRAFDFGLMSRS